jgi:hypothetical protein
MVEQENVAACHRIQVFILLIVQLDIKFKQFPGSSKSFDTPVVARGTDCQVVEAIR